MYICTKKSKLLSIFNIYIKREKKHFWPKFTYKQKYVYFMFPHTPRKTNSFWSKITSRRKLQIKQKIAQIIDQEIKY